MTPSTTHPHREPTPRIAPRGMLQSALATLTPCARAGLSDLPTRTIRVTFDTPVLLAEAADAATAILRQHLGETLDAYIIEVRTPDGACVLNRLEEGLRHAPTRGRIADA